MTELTKEKLNKILEKHKHWINEDCKNWEEMRADLRNAVLSGANVLKVFTSLSTDRKQLITKDSEE